MCIDPIMQHIIIAGIFLPFDDQSLIFGKHDTITPIRIAGIYT
jgi:hypothetical protein